MIILFFFEQLSKVRIKWGWSSHKNMYKKMKIFLILTFSTYEFFLSLIYLEHFPHFTFFFIMEVNFVAVLVALVANYGWSYQNYPRTNTESTFVITHGHDSPLSTSLKSTSLQRFVVEEEDFSKVAKGESDHFTETWLTK